MKPLPEEPVIPEVIADTLTRDRTLAEALAARFRYHWRTSKGFRKSFSRRDERDQCAVWMRHWMHNTATTLRYLNKPAHTARHETPARRSPHPLPRHRQPAPDRATEGRRGQETRRHETQTVVARQLT